MKKIIFVFLLMFSSLILSQTQYYIDPQHPSASNSNAGTTPGSPWRTLDALDANWNNFGPGTYINLAQGSVFAPSTLSRPSGRNNGVIEIPNSYARGTRYNPITIRNYIGYDGPGAKPVISARNLTGYNHAIRAKMFAYIKFYQLAFDNGGNAGIIALILGYQEGQFGNTALGNHDIIFQECDITDGIICFYPYLRDDETGGARPGGWNYVPDRTRQMANTVPIYRVWFIDNLFHDTKRGWGDPDAITMAKGMRGWNDGSGFIAYTDTNIWLHGNQFLETGEEAIDIGGGSNHLIEYNIVSGSFANGLKMHSQDQPVYNSTVRYNLFIGSGYNYPTNWATFNFALENTDSVEVYNNTAVGLHAVTFRDDERNGSYGYYSTLQNNFFYNNNWIGSFNTGGKRNIRNTYTTLNHEDSLTHHNDIRYNNYRLSATGQSVPWGTENRLIRIFPVICPSGEDETCTFNYSTDTYHIYQDGSPVSGYRGSWTNIWLGSPFNQSGKGEISVNPDVVDDTWTSPYSYGNWTPNGTSSLVDAGTTYVSIFFPQENIDLAGNPRVSGSTVDIGAYEAQIGPVPAYLSFSPSAPYNMGNISPGSSPNRTVRITNSGTTGDITITTAMQSQNYFVINYGDTTSAVLSPSEYIDVNVRFDGDTVTVAQAYSANLIVTFTGASSPSSPYNYLFQTTVVSGDVEFAIDDSSHIFQTQLSGVLNLNSNFDNFTSAAEGNNPVDWTIVGEDVLPQHTNYVEQGYTAGTAVLNSNGTTVQMKQYNVLTQSQRAMADVKIDSLSTGVIRLENSTEIVKTWTAGQVGTYKVWFIPVHHSLTLTEGSSGSTRAVFDHARFYNITSSWTMYSTIENTGAGTLTCDSIVITTDAGDAFSVIGSTTFSLGAGETTQIAFGFAPPDTGKFTGEATIYGLNAGNYAGTCTIDLEGYYETAYEPTTTNYLRPIGLTSNTWTLADTDTGDTLLDTLLVYNDGTDTTTIDSISYYGSSDIVLLNVLADTTIAPGDTLAIIAQFKPTSSGIKTIYASVYHDGSNLTTPYVITTTGTATIAQTDPYIVQINPASGNTISFGAIAQGAIAYGRIIWSNTGTTTFTYSAGLYGNDGGFTYVSGGLIDSTQQDELDTLLFKLETSVLGSHLDTVAFTSHNASNWAATKLFVLSGTIISATDPGYSISADYYNFGSVNVGDTSSYSFNITNTESGTVSGVISIENNDQFTLANGGSYSTALTHTFTVYAHPKDEMDYHFQIYVTHNDDSQTSPDTIDVYVQGNWLPHIKAYPSYFDLGSVYLGNYSDSDPIYICNIGGGSVVVDSAYMNVNDEFTINDTAGYTLPANVFLGRNGGFDLDSLWTFSSAGITNNRLGWTTASNTKTASIVLPNLSASTDYILIFNVYNHTGSGDIVTFSLGSSSLTDGVVRLEASEYNDGTYVLPIRSGSANQTFTIETNPGTALTTQFDSFKLVRYHPNVVRFTPNAGSSLIVTDYLEFEHDDANRTNPLQVQVTGYKSTGGLQINGNSNYNKVIKK